MSLPTIDISRPLPEVAPQIARAQLTQTGEPRWNGQDLRAFQGTYGDHLVAKVAKVFPQPRQLT